MENNNFKKSDLKTGMWVENRNGILAMVLLGTKNGDIISGQTWCPLAEYRENLLRNDISIKTDYDIVKVYQPKSNSDYLGYIDMNKEVFNTSRWILLWDRNQELKEITELKKSISDIEKDLQGMKEKLDELTKVTKPAYPNPIF